MGIIYITKVGSLDKIMIVCLAIKGLNFKKEQKNNCCSKNVKIHCFALNTFI